MTILNQALALASRGFHVFPLKNNGKLPAHKGWQDSATRDPEQITKWFSSQKFNVGISTSKFGENRALCVVDVDDKGVKHGSETLLGLELDGIEFPVTCEHSTPSGGRHLIYVCDAPLRQGTDVLGSGLDIRSRGGLIVGPGSEIDGKAYTQINGHSQLTPAPAWLVSRLGVDAGARRSDSTPVGGVDPLRAAERAAGYLKDAAPALEGQGGDTHTYKIFQALKDMGCTLDQAVMLADEYWNERCEPPWSLAELLKLADHAYRYGREQPGCSAPEAIFEPVEPPEGPAAKLHPFAEINREYALIKQGCFILQETTDEEGNRIIERLPISDFHNWFANKPWATGKEKPRPISQHWMEWSGRRQYDAVTFMPGKDMGPRWYNLWQGFSVEPAKGKASHPSLDLFLEHALKNVCGNDPKLFHWLMGFFAHMIQRPWEKPLVALAFKGKKGTGKNALVERVGHLIGVHFLVATSERYLVGNFNSHLEHNLCLVLNEATWAGDKKTEGILKGLITENKMLIEHKGKEARNKQNVSRIILLGNEDWVVPASQEERRFAVFNVGEERMQDKPFFIAMREGMEQGGYSHLLRYLLDFDLSTVDINDAPKTQGLVEQKHASLEIVEEWWLNCLMSGEVLGSDFGGEWPDSANTNRLRDACQRWAGKRNVKGRMPSDIAFGKTLRRVAPSFKSKKARPDKPGDTSYAFFSPGLERLRADWVKFIGGEVEWPD